MARISRQSVLGAGESLGGLFSVLAQIYQRNKQLEQINQARQGATSQVQVGATPIDFSRPNAGQMGVRSVSPGMPQDSIATNPMQFPVEQSLDRAKYLQNLLQIVSGNPMAKEEIGIQSAFLPKPQFIPTGRGGVIEARPDPFGGKTELRGISKGTPDLPEGFSSITDPKAKADLWNQTYGSNLPPEAFNPRLTSKKVTKEEKGKPVGYVQFFDASGNMVTEHRIGEEFRSGAGNQAKLYSYLNKFNADPQVRKSQGMVDSAATIADLLDSNNPVADNAIPTFMARASGEVGNLSEADKAPFGGSAALSEKISQVAQRAATGALTDDNRRFVRQLAETMSRAGRRNMKDLARTRAKQFSRLEKDFGEEEVFGILYPFEDGEGASPKVLSDEDEAAVRWARQNPNDPRAKEILRLNGIQ